MAKTDKWLVITEKPSVALDITKALGGFQKKEDFYESEDFYVTWAIGHLLELLPPEEIDPKYKAWLLKDLPILPEKFQYKPKDGQKGRLDAIKNLANKASVKGFVNACDAGREGELIFREIYDFCGVEKETRRLWLQSMTAAAIKKEFAALRPGSDYDALGDAARCRAESDWLIGMNGTRAVTKRLKQRMQKGSWSVGRVQTPTLALLVTREMDILKHRPEPYYTVEGTFSTPTHEYNAHWFDPAFKKSASAAEDDTAAVREKEDRIFSTERLKKILESLEKNKDKATATETRKESKEIPPQLFDLTSLQREANRRFGISASRTLQAGQRLYEKHKVITYPRTDSKYLPEEYTKNCTDILSNLRELPGPLGQVSKKIHKNGLLNKDRIFNDKYISDHFAIIPTGENLNAKLDGDDGRIFDLILRRFLAAFMSHAVWAKVERITLVADNNFRTRVQDLQEPGWREVYGLDTEEESKLPKLSSANEKVVTEKINHQEHATKPAPRVTEAKLLSLMEHCGREVDDEEIAAALGEKGIGTPATRADIIENLIHKEYASRVGKALKPSSKGIRLLDVLGRIPITGLASVELTGEMEFDLKRMEKKEKSRADFMKAMKEYTAEIVEKSRSFDYDAIYAPDAPVGKCPMCKKADVRESFWGFRCNEKECGFIIWKEKNQRYIDRTLVQELLEKGTLKQVEFYSGSGVPYLADITITPKGLALLDENGKPIEALSASEAKVLHEEMLSETYLKMPAKVIETEIAYLCEFGDGKIEEKKEPKKPRANAKPVDETKKKKAPPKRITARMPKILCGRPITLDEFKQYVVTGATPAITNFTSKKGRPFAARLHMKANGSFEFKFEARPKKEPVEGAEKPVRKAAASKVKITKKDSSATKTGT